ncbi:MAG: hypothetical protein ABIL22_06225 [candidate division WOR-3 bacterium]
MVEERLVIKEVKYEFLDEILQRYPYIYKPTNYSIIILSDRPKENIALLKEYFGNYNCYHYVVVLDLVNKTARVSNLLCCWTDDSEQISYDELVYHLVT